MEEFGPPLSMTRNDQISLTLNNFAWAVFEYSDNKEELK